MNVIWRLTPLKSQSQRRVVDLLPPPLLFLPGRGQGEDGERQQRVARRDVKLAKAHGVLPGIRD